MCEGLQQLVAVRTEALSNAGDALPGWALQPACSGVPQESQGPHSQHEGLSLEGTGSCPADQ